MDLDPGGEIWAELGGEVRTREAWENRGLARDGDTYGELRLRLHSDFHFLDRARLYSEVLSAWGTGRDLPGGNDPSTDELTLQNAFLELRFAGEPRRGLRLRAGRQEIALGSERLVGPADFRNAGRHTFDGVTLAWLGGELELLSFVLFPVEAREGERNRTEDDPFAGVWLAHGGSSKKTRLELYLLALDREREVQVLGPGPLPMEIELRDRRFTLGGRLHLERALATFELEGGVQGGGRRLGGLGGGDQRVGAWFASAEVGRRLESCVLSPRLWLGVDFASGGDGLLEGGAFDPPFPSEHPFLGHADLVGRANVLDLRGGAELSPRAALSLALEAHGFWRASDDDGLYSPSGSIVRRSRSQHRFVGLEIDLELRWSPSRHWTLALGFARMFPGELLEASGPDVVGFGYAEVTLRF